MPLLKVGILVCTTQVRPSVIVWSGGFNVYRCLSYKT